MEKGMDKQYLSVNEMAAELSISRSSAWRWVREGELQTYRFVGDRKTYVKRDDLEKLREPIPITEPKKAAA
jgi:excisionase family DNA binding protein